MPKYGAGLGFELRTKCSYSRLRHLGLLNWSGEPQLDREGEHVAGENGSPYSQLDRSEGKLEDENGSPY